MKTLFTIWVIVLILMLSSCSFFDKLIEARELDVEIPTANSDVRG